VDVQFRIEVEPSVITVGFAISDTTGRLFTVTVTLLVDVPDVLLAVSVYMVVTVGCTVAVPERRLFVMTP